MRFWLTSFFILFALVKLVEWLRSLQVPFAVVVIAGLLLAIASNYDKRNIFPFWSEVMASKAMAAEREAGAGSNVALGRVEASDSSFAEASVESAPNLTVPDLTVPSFTAADFPIPTSPSNSSSEPELPPFNN